MSDLVVIAFDKQEKAEEVLRDLQRLEQEHLIDLEDAAVVIRKQNGKIKLKQSFNLVASGAVGGSFWGLLIGLLFLNPIVGILTGSIAGAATGALTDIGINDQFMKDLGQNIKAGGSALFILVRKITPDKVMTELEKYAGQGRVLRTSLSIADEERLRDVLTEKKESLIIPHQAEDDRSRQTSSGDVQPIL